MKQASPIRLGLIGCGRATRESHLPALRRVQGLRVEAICDIREHVARSVATCFHIPRWFTRWHELLPHVEAVAVCTPPVSHAEIAVEALKAGLHVLVEKPLALSLAECDWIAEASSKAGRMAMVAHNNRWHPLVQRARDLLHSGALGPVCAVHSLYTHAHPDWGDHWHRYRHLGGGVILNDAVHHFDLWRFLVGAEILEAGCLKQDSERFQDDTAVVVARLSGGVLAAATFSFSTAPRSVLEVFCARASLELDLYRCDGLRIYWAQQQPGSPRQRLARILSSLRALPPAVKLAAWGGIYQVSYRGMWENFARAIREGAPALCTVEDGRAAVQAALMCTKPH